MTVLLGINGILFNSITVAYYLRKALVSTEIASCFPQQSDKDHCLLLALPCGRDPLDVHAQTRALKSGFINYLQQKQAAGIINVARPGSTQVNYDPSVKSPDYV